MLNRTIVINPVEPALLSLRSPLGIALDLGLTFQKQDGTPVDPDTLMPQLALLPRSGYGVLPYDMVTSAPEAGKANVTVPGNALIDLRGYSIELYARRTADYPENPPVPIQMLAKGVLRLEGSAYQQTGPLAMINVPTIVGPRPAGSAGRTRPARLDLDERPRRPGGARRRTDRRHVPEHDQRRRLPLQRHGVGAGGLLMNEWVKQGNIKGPTGGTFPDAPSDGTVYGRKDAAWEPVATPADVSTAVADEAALRAAADAGLASDIDAEEAARIAADNTLQTNINNEAAARIAADALKMDKSVYDPGNIAANVYARANHIGTQLAATISDFAAAADARITAAIGVTVQAFSAALTSWAAVVRAAGLDAFAANPTSANLRTLVTDESGTGALLFQNGALGTPTSGTATNLTGLPYGGLLAAAISTVAEYLSNTASKLASVNTLWAAAVPVALTSAASITANFGTFIDSECAMTVDGALAAPSGVKNGQKGVMWFTASGATRTLTLNAAYLLMTGVEAGPYAITTTQLLGVAYVARGGSIYVTSVLRRG